MEISILLEWTTAISFYVLYLKRATIMYLKTEPYLTQIETLPQQGEQIIAQYDEDTIVLYQAYNPAIGHFAAKQGYFGGDFSYSRMSWIKPNFLWMMFRSGWGTKPNQEVTLAIWLQRAGFEAMLAQAVPSAYDPNLYASQTEWKREGSKTDVRIQWDPDHSPTGGVLQRRAIQLGIRGETLRRFGREWIVNIEDISDFVATQRQNAAPPRYSELQVPVERLYPTSTNQ
jgi:hypothetical protein